MLLSPHGHNILFWAWILTEIPIGFSVADSSLPSEKISLKKENWNLSICSAVLLRREMVSREEAPLPPSRQVVSHFPQRGINHFPALAAHIASGKLEEPEVA